MLQNAYFLAKSVPIQPKTSNILPKFCQKLATTLRGRALGLPELVPVVELGLELLPVRREGPQELLRLLHRRVRLLGER